MTRTKSAFLTVSAIGLTALVAAAPIPASAQTTTTPPAPPAARAHEAPTSHTEQQRLAQLHKRLRITPAQESAWSQFAQTSIQNATQLDDAFRERAAQLQSMNAVQNMQSFAKLDMQRAQDMQQQVPAFQQLYAALSPDQQRIADEMFRNAGQRAAARKTAHR